LRVSPNEAVNIIYISTNEVDLSDYLPGNAMLSKDSYNIIIAAEAI